LAVLDLVQWTDERPDEIVRRVPETGSGEFRLGSQLVVRENQSAVFVRDGKALDSFGPGRHTLSTNNIPLLGGLIGAAFGGNSPFTAEVFFVSNREFTGLKWGTPTPMTFADSQLGMVRLRAFGTFSIRVTNPMLFVNYIVGTRGGYSISNIEDFLRSIIVSNFNDILGDLKSTLTDLPGMMTDLNSVSRASLSDDFDRIGLEIVTFQVEAITPPEEVAKMIDQRSGMGAIGDMGAFTQFQAAQAMRDAAQNPGGGGAAATGVGLGAGMAMGQAMADAINQGQRGGQQGGATSGAAGGAQGQVNFCPNCGSPVTPGAKFCANCGYQLIAE
jgi:membrane protease subunit (stomatin/prohibitin family)